MAEEQTQLQWVERLLEPSIEDTLMIQAAQVFSQSHYSDVVEERNIGHLCGYPVCGNALGEQPQQKYHVSLAQKKVFDLTERKKFCSSECYKASNYYVSQLSSLPLAARDDQRSVAIDLLPCASGKSAIAREGATESAIAHVVNAPVTGTMKKDIIARETPTVTETTAKMGMLHLSDDDDDDEVSDLVSSQPKCPELSSVSRLLHSMSSWSTPDTFQLLTCSRQQSAVERAETSCTTDDCSPASGTDKQESVGERQCQPRSTEEVQTGRGGGDMESHAVPGEGGDVSRIMFPPVHSSAQSQLRMTIFVQQLRRNFPSVTTQLSLNLHEILPRVISLVRTFRLSRHTVTFKPAEWKVIIFVLIRISSPLLSSVNPEWGVSALETALVQKWIEGISASENDLKLMFTMFKT